MPQAITPRWIAPDVRQNRPCTNIPLSVCQSLPLLAVCVSVPSVSLCPLLDLSVYATQHPRYSKDPELPTIRCRGLPDNVATEIRVVEMSELDKNLCCGTHLKTTAYLQLIKLLKLEKAKKNMRLWFVVGDRALHQLGVMFTRQSALTAMLTVAPGQCSP